MLLAHVSLACVPSLTHDTQHTIGIYSAHKRNIGMRIEHYVRHFRVQDLDSPSRSAVYLVSFPTGLLLVPLDLLSSLGIVAAVTVSCAMFVNLTLTPTLILTFPRYFKKAMTEGIFCRGLKKGKYAINSSDEYVCVAKLHR